MFLKNLKPVLHSNRGNVQMAVIWDSQTGSDLADGTIDFLVEEYGDLQVKRIEAQDNQLILTV